MMCLASNFLSFLKIQAKSLVTRTKRNTALVFKDRKGDPGIYRSVSLTSVAGKIFEQILTGGNAKAHAKDKEMI